MTLRPIGHIETPYHALEECPRRTDPDGPDCWIVVDPAYAAGISGLEAGRPILVLYWFDGVDRNRLVQTRPGGDRPSGVFALRSPHRPNPIAAAIVTIHEVAANRIRVKGMDCLDGTPLVDIKPHRWP